MGAFTLEKASMEVVCVFTQRTPEMRRSPKQTYTPGTPAMAAVNARSRFSRASVSGWESGSCEPVRITGLPAPASMKESAAAV